MAESSGTLFCEAFEALGMVIWRLEQNQDDVSLSLANTLRDVKTLLENGIERMENEQTKDEPPHATEG